jgi:hypothetical protein
MGLTGSFSLKRSILLRNRIIDVLMNPRVADGVKQGQGLLHSVDCLIFEQKLIVLGDGDEEKDGGNVLEAVNPLLSLGSLTTDVEHSVGEVTDDERGLGDTSGLDTRPEDILIVRHVVGGRNSRDVIKVVSGGVVQLILSRSLKALLHTTILPQGLDGAANLRGENVALNLSGLHEDGLDVVLHALVFERKLERLHGLEDNAH